MFELKSKYSPSGDQPQAIEKLVAGIKNGEKHQVLLGATGTGKTYTIANVIKEINKPTLILAHNKTLAGQLYSEFRELFPDNRVEYFVSYYDYYQPEAYVASSDTYIEKTSSVNDEIDQLRHSATASLLQRKDVIVIASVSCIYGIGEIEDYQNKVLTLTVGDIIDRDFVLKKLIEMLYERNQYDFVRGSFRVNGDTIEIIPVSQNSLGIRIEMFGDEIEKVSYFDILTGKISENKKTITLFPASHFVTDEEKLKISIERIKNELKERLEYLNAENKLVEAQRLESRVNYDIEMLSETGFCSGVENYSRHIALKDEGETPTSLIDFFKNDYLLVIDESHVTVPQVRGMYNGDRARKKMLVDHGFRLPSALDNRPLNFDEFKSKINQVIYVSATPGDYELELVDNNTVQQIIRPTGLLDPTIEIKPSKNQIDDLIEQIKIRTDKNERVMITTITIRMAEELTNYLKEVNIKVAYLHSEVKTLQRMKIIEDLRIGKYDVLIGINLLREGLDVPEVSLIAILDADKQGFLRSDKSLIQTIGRCARNENGHVILYADKMSEAMKIAISETERRRKIQHEYNIKHGIVPKTIVKTIHEAISNTVEEIEMKKSNKQYTKKEKEKLIKEIEQKMNHAAKELNFEDAVKYRDILFELKLEE